MLLQYSCSNYRSIKDNVSFSMIKVAGEASQNRIMNFRKMEVESVSAIYGANGSGKTNFLLSLESMKFLVENSLKFQPGQKIKIPIHKLSDRKDASEFSIQFTVGGVRYAYGFSVIEGLIDEEYLYHFLNGRQAKIFERKGLKITTGSRYKHSFGVSLEVLKENRLFLSCAANYSRVIEVSEAYMFFSEGLVAYRVNVDEPPMNNWHGYSVSLMHENPEIKKQLLHVLNLLGTGIKDVRSERRIYSAEEISRTLPEPFREFILTPEIRERGVVDLKAKVVYPEFETDLMTEEGTGIQKLFQMICPLLDIIEKGKVIFCDELETGLHEAVVQQLIELFYTLKPDSEAQLIFTTHDTGLLNSRLFRRGQIWFTELRHERSTDLYSLAEIKNVRKGENLERGYMQGKYGAIPMLNTELLDILKKSQQETDSE